MSGKSQMKHDGRRPRHSIGNLGQEEAALEKASKAQMRHMEGGKAAESAQQQKTETSRKDEN